MKTSGINIALMVFGTICIGIGAFRAVPIKLDNKFWWQTGPLAVALIVIYFLSAWTGGTKFLKAGVDGTTAVTSSFLILLVLLMPVIGFSGPLAKYYESTIAGALESKFGYVWAMICAFISPGGNAFSGVIANLWPDKPALRPLLLYFLTVVPLTSFTIFYIRCLGLGEEIGAEMYRVNWFVAVWLAPLFWAYGKWFYR
ncbi:MAG TPA: hypothetical protein VLG69_01185 [Candidatus Andersenbacteria bacterium]|nr:hypothetical protein [Candidatus Andersenbacteria bacterium]